jgi:hypothetical protein
MILRAHNDKVRKNGHGRPKAWRICLWSTAPVILLSLSLDPCFSQHLDSKSRDRMSATTQSARVATPLPSVSTGTKVFGSVRFNKKSDAESSVQLLETIINRIMNIPQVAQAVQLNKNTGSQIIAQNMKQQASQAAQGQGVDYKLAIRPKETGRTFATGVPTLQMIAQNNLPADGYGAGGGGSAGYQLKAGNYAAPTVDSLDSGAAAENWKGSAMTRLPIAYNKNEVLANADKPGFWDRDAAKDSSAMRGASMKPTPPSVSRVSSNAAGGAFGASSAGEDDFLAEPQGHARGLQMPSYEEAKNKNPDLAASINRFYKATKRIEELQNATPEKLQKQMRDAIASAPGTEKAHFANAARDIQILDERPAVHDFREGDAAQGNLRAKAEMAAAAPSAPSPSRRKAKEASPKSELNTDKEGRLNKLALLPPNVATGTTLPLVSLGNSESQVTQFLGRIGKLQEQKIKNWSVYSWYKKEGDGTVSLQLFFKHGMLDAIRIYDPTLVAADFGAAPGDSLEAVKERFGEPAFLLPEPGSTTGGKNYIYPISQVAFQLARPTGETPQVVSVLIFSVK